jgi:small subunit ribosomal protein S5
MAFEQSTKGDGLQEKLIFSKRHSKTTTGGRTFSYVAGAAVGAVVDDGKGCIIGFGKQSAREVAVAMPKALEKARRNRLYVALNNNTIHHQVEATYGATKVIIFPAEETGVIAGGAMRAIFAVAGIKNVVAKIIGSRNPVNVVQATFKALKKISTPESIAEKRGKKLSEIL